MENPRKRSKENKQNWDNGYLDVLLGYEWELTKSPAGAHQWTPKKGQGAPEAPDASDSSKTQPLMMSTVDMAMKMDPEYRKICEQHRCNINDRECEMCDVLQAFRQLFCFWYDGAQLRCGRGP